MGVCRLHWPEDIPFKKVKGHERPDCPPCIFNCPSSIRPQTTSLISRNVSERRVISESRSTLPDELDTFLELDKIPSFIDFLKQLPQKDFIRNMDIDIVIRPNFVRICKFAEYSESLEFTIVIKSDYSVSAKRSNTVVAVSDLLGFQCHLAKWSQLEAVLNRVNNAVLSVKSEIIGAVGSLKKVLEQCSDEKPEHLDFILEQLELKTKKSQGRRSTAQTTMISLTLYLSSRCAYKELRKYLCLPHPSTTVVASLMLVQRRTL